MAVVFTPSTRFQQWMVQLRVSWMGRKAQAIMGTFANVLGDKTYDWALRATLEHLPEYASPQSVGLTGSERQLDQGPVETSAAYATRVTQAAVLWKYAGTPLGMLLALHYAGVDNCVLVQQNGRAYQLQLPLPPIPVIAGQAWNPQTALIVTQLSQLAVVLTSNVTPPTVSSPGRSIPAGNSWFEFDFNSDFCSRFAVLIPAPSQPFYTTGRATFTNSSSAVATWSSPFADTTYLMLPGPSVVTDGGPGVAVSVDGTASSKKTTSVIVNASEAFTGYVDVLAWQTGANPFADLHPADLQRLKSTIVKWKPAKATCLGVVACTQGKFMSWPVQLQAANTMGTATIVNTTGVL